MAKIKNRIANKRMQKKAEAQDAAFRDLKAEMQQLMDTEDYVAAMDVMADGSVNQYPLNITGSDGAVSAIFTYNGQRYPFVYTVDRKDEPSLSRRAAYGELFRIERWRTGGEHA